MFTVLQFLLVSNLITLWHHHTHTNWCTFVSE